MPAIVGKDRRTKETEKEKNKERQRENGGRERIRDTTGPAEEEGAEYTRRRGGMRASRERTARV